MNLESNFPKAFDSDSNLFMVQDSLKLLLLHDYHPGQKVLYVDGSKEVFDKFPETGILTLIDQVSHKTERSISFYYGGKGRMMFTGLEMMPGQKDSFKPAIETSVTQNVMAIHRTVLKDAILAIQKFLGTKGIADPEPFGPTIMGRLNYIRKAVLSPRAWFTASADMGMAPAAITFTAEGAPQDGGRPTYEWDFGDGTSETTSEAQIEKVYNNPGYYDVTLKITNDFGSDTVNFPKMIGIKAQSPDKAMIEFIPSENQLLTNGVLRTPVNQFINLQVKEGRKGNKSFAGELLTEEGHAHDPIFQYTWNIQDDLPHANSHRTRAVYSVGGIYDFNLRTDTKLGSYRITNLDKCIDVVEDTNLWMWNFSDPSTVQASEFGLLCETFKVRPTTQLTVKANSSFLTTKAAVKEFKRNNGFVKKGVSSGQGGTCLLCWASGRSPIDPMASEKINIAEYNGFTDVYTTHPPIARAWNWAVLSSEENMYFVFGDSEEPKITNHSPTKQLKTTLNLSSMAVSNEQLGFGNYKGHAQELKENAVTYDSEGDPIEGHFSIYRTAWKGMAGYILRNKPGEFVTLKNFYKTEGTVGDPFKIFRKLPDMEGMSKSEGQLVPMTRGIFCFDNSGSVSMYNDTTRTWEITDANLTVTSFRITQDSKVTGHQSSSNTLLAASDGNDKAYLSFDYSPNAFVRFNEVDLTFHSLGHRPQGEQWQMGIF